MEITHPDQTWVSDITYACLKAERFMRTIKEEKVDLSEYNDFAGANYQIGNFIQEVDMTKRIHSSLGYLTSAEFETSCWLSLSLKQVEYRP